MRGAGPNYCSSPQLQNGPPRPKRPSTWQQWARIETLVAPDQRINKLHPHHADMSTLWPLGAESGEATAPGLAAGAGGVLA